MVKLVMVVTPKAGMNREEFQRHWLGVHAPIAKKIPGLTRYVVNAAQPQPDGTPSALGGIAELWFESLETMKVALSSEEAKSARADLSNFTDVARNVAGLVDEHVIA